MEDATASALQRSRLLTDELCDELGDECMDELTEQEWDLVLDLARRPRAGSASDYVRELRASGLREAICSSVAIRLALGEIPPDPDEGWTTQRVGERIEIRTRLDGGAAPVYQGVFQKDGERRPVAVKMFGVPKDERAAAALREAW